MVDFFVSNHGVDLVVHSVGIIVIIVSADGCLLDDLSLVVPLDFGFPVSHEVTVALHEVLLLPRPVGSVC